MKVFSLAILLLIAVTVFASDESLQMRKRRLKIDKKQGMSVITKKHIQRRTLAAPWRNLRIFFDLAGVKLQKPERFPFYEKAFAVTAAYWGQALMVNDNAQQNAGIVKGLNIFKLPPGKKFTDYDLFIPVKWGQNNGATLAYAGPDYRNPQTQRPITGSCFLTPYGDNFLQNASYALTRAVGTMIHELGHILAFTGIDHFHKQYVKQNPAIKSLMWTGPKVKQVAKVYYACNKGFKGVPLQTDKKTGGTGGHWSETFLGDELLTPSTGANPEKISPMTLAFMEDTKWYKANFNMVENYKDNKFSGCNFSNQCPQPPACQPGTSDFVTKDQKAVGYCKKDDRGCAREIKYKDAKCDSAVGWPSWMVEYGATYGGKSTIFGGVAIDAEGRDVKQLCAKASCNKAMTQYTYTLGAFKAVCSKKGVAKFQMNGFPGEVNCMDPKAFCKARFGGNMGKTGKCSDTCLTNGRCQRPQNLGRRLQNLKVDKSPYMCWCYSDYKPTKGKCPPLAVDRKS